MIMAIYLTVAKMGPYQSSIETGNSVRNIMTPQPKIHEDSVHFKLFTFLKSSVFLSFFMLGNFHAILSSADFLFQNHLFKDVLHEHYQSV